MLHALKIISELIFKMAKLDSKKYTSVNEKSAAYLYTGIVTDTGRFLFNSTNAKTLTIAGKLLEVNFNFSTIYNKLYKINPDLIKYNAYVTINVIKHNNVAYFVAPKNIENKFNLDYSEVSSQVNTVMKAGEIDYGVYLTWSKKEKIWKGSIRSKKKPINKLAEQFNGGGHANAAGFKLTAKKEIKNIVADLIKLSNNK